MFLTHLSKAKGLTHKRDHFIGAFISLLLGCGGPPTVPRFIVSVIVWVTIQGMFIGGAFPHIGKEVFEGEPSCRHDNSSVHIPVGTSRIWVSGPSLSVSPTTISSREPHPVGFQSNGIHSLSSFLTNAPTGLCWPLFSFEVCGGDIHGLPAVTQALPNWGPSIAFNDSGRSQSSVFLDRLSGRATFFLSFIHGNNMLRLSEGHSATTGGLCAVRIALREGESRV